MELIWIRRDEFYRAMGRLDRRFEEIEEAQREGLEKMQTAWQDAIDLARKNRDLSSSIKDSVTKLIDLFASQPTLEDVKALAATLKESGDIDEATAAMLANTPAGRPA